MSADADDLIDTFMDAIREKLAADEFDRLMTGKQTGAVLDRIKDYGDLSELGMRDWEVLSPALRDLKASLALERLQGRYPELWEQAAMESAATG